MSGGLFLISNLVTIQTLIQLASQLKDMQRDYGLLLRYTHNIIITESFPKDNDIHTNLMIVIAPWST